MTRPTEGKKSDGGVDQKNNILLYALEYNAKVGFDTENHTHNFTNKKKQQIISQSQTQTTVTGDIY